MLDLKYPDSCVNIFFLHTIFQVSKKEWCHGSFEATNVDDNTSAMHSWDCQPLLRGQSLMGESDKAKYSMVDSLWEF